MRHRIKGKILDRKKESREAMLRNLATSIIIYEKVKTTRAKAKAVRTMVEKSITLGKTNNLKNRRELLKILYFKKAVNKTLEVLGPKYKDRKGGYTRITNLGRRKGDAAQIVQIELV
ncbi:50S ribosomal protein L17 [Patescibacteria group bacterium]|nr:50S ribosomal protein L17 [Patescibacteria group bacterium]